MVLPGGGATPSSWYEIPMASPLYEDGEGFHIRRVVDPARHHHAADPSGIPIAAVGRAEVQGPLCGRRNATARPES